MNEQITGLASLGRYEDNRIAHVADGEMIVPPLAISLATRRQIFRDMLNQGINPANYIVGSSMGINPNSGLPEFFLKKLVKKIIKPVKKVVKFQTGLVKKVVKSKLFKKLAPYAGIIAAPFTGGLSAALIGGLGGLASGKGLKGGIMGALGGFGASAALGKLGLTASAIKGAGGLGAALKAVPAKLGLGSGGIKSLFAGKGGFSSLLGGGSGTGGFSSLLGGGSGTGGISSLLGSSQSPLMTLAKSAISGDSNPLKTLALGRMGRSSNPLLRMVSNAYGQQVSDPNDPDAMNREYDLYNENLMKQFYDQQMKNAAGVAVPAGALSYYAAKKEADNPLQDVRDTIRPDLRMADVYGQGGFDLGFKGYSDGGPVRALQNNPLFKFRRALPSYSPDAKFIDGVGIEDVAKDVGSSLYDIYQITQSPEQIGVLAARAQQDFGKVMAEAQELFNDGTKPIQEFVDKVRQGYRMEKEKEMIGYSGGGEVLEKRLAPGSLAAPARGVLAPSSLAAAGRGALAPAQSTLYAAARGAFPIASMAARFNPYGAALGSAISLYSLYKMSQDPEQVGALAARAQKDFEETMAEAQQIFNDGTQPIKEFIDKVRQGYMTEKEREMTGYAEGGEVLDMRDGGESIGPGTGTSDDIPAMLSDGEFVMTASANNGMGGYKITKEKDSLTLIPNGKPSRKKGAQNMMNLMKTFEKYNEGKA